ncbi:CaiB/BaiF CoA transferase family protein [Streptomyces sp. NPDC002758]
MRVLELSHIVAGPSAGFILSELGADTIRVEPTTGGDRMRSVDTPSNRGWFAFANRNKRSLSVDLKSSAGREVVRRLVATADIVLENFGPGVLNRLGLSFAELTKANPNIICLHLKGFLPGPNENRPLLDEAAQIMGGLAFMTGSEGQPRRIGASVVDMGAAAYGVIAALAALVQRQRVPDRSPQEITAGLFETVAYWASQDMARFAVDGGESVPYSERPQALRMGFPVYRLFDTADNRQIFVGITSDAHWKRFCAELELTDLWADPRLASGADRVSAHAWLLPTIADRLKRRTLADLEARLSRANVVFAPVRRPDELVRDEHLRQSGCLPDTPIAGHASSPLPTLPIISSAYRFASEAVRPAPGRGEHSIEVLSELGYSTEEIRALTTDGRIVCGVPLEEEVRRRKGG